MSENTTKRARMEANGDADAETEAAVHDELARTLGVAWEDLVLRQRPNHRKVIVPDVTSKFFVHAKGVREAWFVYLASPSHPDSVEASFRRARAIAAALSAPLAEHVMLPRWEGRIDGRSFAVTPRLEGICANRIRRTIQRMRLVPMVCDWIESAISETRRVVDAPRITAPLVNMANMHGLPAELRAAATATALEFESGRLPAVHAVNHRDLWSGNVLFRPSVLAGLPQSDFRLIDWGAATMDAAPGYDLLSFTRDTLVPAFFARRRCCNLARIIGCRPDQLRHYAIASIASLSCDLAEWPVSAFSQAAQRTMRYVDELFG